MNKVFQINPSGEFLMDFCYVNLWTYENQVNLLSGNLIEKMQFYLIKRKISKKINILFHAIFVDYCLDFNLLETTIEENKNGIWDNSLDYIIIRNSAIWSRLDFSLPIEEKVNHVLFSYLAFIKENNSASFEIIKNKIEIIKIQAEMDLLIASAAKNNTSGQFKF